MQHKQLVIIKHSFQSPSPEGNLQSFMLLNTRLEPLCGSVIFSCSRMDIRDNKTGDFYSNKINI